MPVSYQVIIGKCAGGSTAKSFKDHQEAVDHFLTHVVYAFDHWRNDQADVHIMSVVLMHMDNGTIDTVSSIDFPCPHKARNGRRRPAHA